MYFGKDENGEDCSLSIDEEVEIRMQVDDEIEAERRQNR